MAEIANAINKLLAVRTDGAVVAAATASRQSIFISVLVALQRQNQKHYRIRSAFQTMHRVHQHINTVEVKELRADRSVLSLSHCARCWIYCA